MEYVLGGGVMDRPSIYDHGIRWREYADWLEAERDKLRENLGRQIKMLKLDRDELEAKLADYEYPLRTSEWVKVRIEVWDRLEAERDKLRVESVNQRAALRRIADGIHYNSAKSVAKAALDKPTEAPSSWDHEDGNHT
jgi:uncharacterized membrane-anchored protein YjiN (DUF445 family)